MKLGTAIGWCDIRKITKYFVLEVSGFEGRECQSCVMMAVFTSVMEALNDTKHCVMKIHGDIWMKLKLYGIHIRSHQVTYKSLV
jgi:hypothetical protein